MAQQLRTQWHWLDHFILLLRCIWLIGSIVQYYPLVTGSPVHLLLLVWIAGSFAVPLFYFRPGRIHVYRYYLTEFALTGSLYVFLVLNGQMQALNFIGLQVMTFGYLGTKTTASKSIAAILIILLTPLTNIAGQFHFTWWDMVLKLFDFILFYGVGLSFHHIVKQYGMIREKNRALEQHTKVIERLTLIEERNRMARDMHDTIGHTFITAITGLNAIKYQMRTDPAEAEKSISELLEVTRDGLQEIRRSIHQISDEQESGSLSDRLSGVAEKFGQYTNTEIIFRSNGIEMNYPENMMLTLTRLLQESLTNAKRHGLAARIEIQLFVSASEIDLAVKDFGQGAKRLKEGFGIRAMRERVSSLRGTLRIDSQAGVGTTVQCKVPLTGDL